MAAQRRKKTPEPIKVTVLALGGEEKVVALEKNATVADALKAAGLDTGRKTEFTVDGQELDEDDVLQDGETLVVTSAGKIEGGSK